MKHRFWLAQIVIGTLTLSSPAWAQDDEDTPGEGEGEGEATGEGGGEGEGAGEASPDEAVPPDDAMPTGAGVGPFTKASYPTELTKRPLTLPRGTLEISPLFAIDHVSAGGESENIITGTLGLGYGITDELTVVAATTLLIDPDFDWGEVIALGAEYLAYDTEKLDIAPQLIVPLIFADEADVLEGIILGADTRFLVHEKVFIRAGNALLPIGFDPFLLDIDLNVGVGFQATPNLAFTLDTQIVSIGVAGDDNDTTHWGDAIPLTLTAFYGINHMLDLFASIEFPSLEDAGDFYGFSVGANIRL